jgi:hypothetical protein
MSLAADRRKAARRHYTQGRLPPAARIRPGTPVTVVDLSATGALVESGLRCKPGARCDFVMITSHGGERTLRARIARCYVARLTSSAVRYRTALMFEEPQPLPDDTLLATGYELPTSAALPVSSGVGTTREAPAAAGPRRS